MPTSPIEPSEPPATAIEADIDDDMDFDFEDDLEADLDIDPEVPPETFDDVVREFGNDVLGLGPAYRVIRARMIVGLAALTAVLRLGMHFRWW